MLKADSLSVSYDFHSNAGTGRCAALKLGVELATFGVNWHSICDRMQRGVSPADCVKRKRGFLHWN